jgi:hypothetical protein
VNEPGTANLIQSPEKGNPATVTWGVPRRGSDPRLLPTDIEGTLVRLIGFLSGVCSIADSRDTIFSQGHRANTTATQPSVKAPVRSSGIIRRGLPQLLLPTGLHQRLFQRIHWGASAHASKCGAL